MLVCSDRVWVYSRTPDLPAPLAEMREEQVIAHDSSMANILKTVDQSCFLSDDDDVSASNEDTDEDNSEVME